MPRIDDMLGKECYFSTLDLASGYQQIEMSDDATKSVHLLLTVVYMNSYVCRLVYVMRWLRSSAMAGMVWQSCFVYIDDVLVCSESLAEHFCHLNEVLCD